MKIEFFIRSSKKIANVRIFLSEGRSLKCYATTDVAVFVEHWDNKLGKMKLMAPIMQKQKVAKRLSEIEQLIYDRYLIDKNSHTINSDWLTDVLKPKPSSLLDHKTDFFILWDQFMDKQKISTNRKASYNSLRSKLERFAHIKGNIPVQPDNKLISALNEFILNERPYIKKYPELYHNITIADRGQNYVNDCLKKYKTFIRWAHFNKYIEYNPFNPYDYVIGTCLYSDPIALSKIELEYIADAPAPSKIPKYLEKIRDMFVLQCYTGPRVSDFIELKRNNVQNGVLQYIPGKTINETQETLFIPLSNRAMSIIEKWNEPDRLFPFLNISGQDGYNKGIKLLLKHLEINRRVMVIDSVTRENKLIPICEIASSHTARKTFASIVYNATGDWKQTASMTGHAANSKAAERYAKAQIPLLKETIKNVFD